MNNSLLLKCDFFNSLIYKAGQTVQIVFPESKNCIRPFKVFTIVEDCYSDNYGNAIVYFKLTNESST